MRLRHTILTTALAALTACGQATAPDATPATSRFVLVATAEQPLPAIVLDTTYEDGSHVQVYAISDTVVIDADDRYTQTSLIHVYLDGRYGGRSRRVDHGTVTRAGQSLRFESGFYHNLRYDGVLVDSMLTIVQDLSGDGVHAPLILHAR